MKSGAPEGQPGSMSNPLKSQIPAQDKAKGADVSLQWWTQDTNDGVVSSISNVLQAIRLFQVGRLNMMNLCIRLYGNRGLSQLFSAARGNAMKIVRQQNAGPDRLTDNVISSCVDTVHSTMSKNKPAPFFLTSGGNYRQQRKAKTLTKLAEGMLYETKAYVKGSLCFRDALITGDGVFHGYVDVDTDRVCLERVPAFELNVDEVEAAHGEPRQMHRVRNVDRAMLQAVKEYQDTEEKRGYLVDSDKVQTDTGGSTPLQVSDTIELRESWHLPSGPKKKDGKHIISTPKGVLFEEPWTDDWFPFVKIPWSEPTLGYWGTSAAQQIMGQQIQINKLLWMESASIHIIGTTKLAYQIGSQVVPENVNNMLGLQIKYSGDKLPAYITPPPFHEAIPQMLTTVKASAFEQLGVSMLAAQSKKPDGLDSGTAIREYNYIQTDRFYAKGILYENFYMDATRMLLRLARKVCERTGHYRIQHYGSDQHYLGEIDLADCDIAEEDSSIKCFPVSSLPQEPAAREATVQEYVQAGWITPQRGRRLMSFPDLEADDNLADAQEEWFLKIIDGIVDEGKYEPPDPLDNLMLAKELFQQEYNLARCGDLEEDRLAFLRTFLQQVDALEQAAMPPPVPGGAPGAPGGVPQGAPPPAPQSNLLPQTAGGGA